VQFITWSTVIILAAIALAGLSWLIRWDLEHHERIDYTDRDLLCTITNQQQCSEESIFLAAADNADIETDYINFIKTGRLPVYVRLHLYRIKNLHS
jgi:hypothetical protein